MFIPYLSIFKTLINDTFNFFSIINSVSTATVPFSRLSLGSPKYKPPVNSRTIKISLPLIFFSFKGDACNNESNPLIGRRFRSAEHTSELQSRGHLVCRLLLETKHCQR